MPPFCGRTRNDQPPQSEASNMKPGVQVGVQMDLRKPEIKRWCGFRLILQ